MVEAFIIINQSGKPAGIPGESREDLNVGTAVTLTNISEADVTSWHWELVSVPNNSTTVLTGANTSTAAFIPDLTGSYLIQLTINGYIQTRIIAAILTGVVRYPASQESNEFNGWERAILNILENMDTGSRPPNGAASGDLSGTYPSPTVSKIMGRSLSVLAPTNGQVLTWSATNSWWLPMTPSLTGSASGDLSGAYPSPTVIKLQGRLVSSSVPTDGFALTWSTGANQWICSKPIPGGTAGGDLASTYPDPVVVKLYGRPMAATSPTVNQILKWDGAQWTPSSSLGNLDRILVFSDDTELTETGSTFVTKKQFRIIRDAANPPIAWRIVVTTWVTGGYGDSAEVRVLATGVGGTDSVTITATRSTEAFDAGDIIITEAYETTNRIITFYIQLRETGTLSTAHLQYTDVYAIY